MKKLFTLFAAAALMLVGTVSAFAADNTYKVCNGKVTVTVTDLAPNADGTALIACYNIDVAPDAIDECSSLVITPLVRDDNHNKKLLEIYGEINRMEKSRTTVESFPVYSEKFMTFALIALFALLLELVFRFFVLRRLTV